MINGIGNGFYNKSKSSNIFLAKFSRDIQSYTFLPNDKHSGLNTIVLVFFTFQFIIFY